MICLRLDLILPGMPLHRFSDNGVFQIIKYVVVVGAEFCLIHEVVKFVLKAFPSAFYASCWELLFRPVSELYIDSRVESSWWNDERILILKASFQSTSTIRLQTLISGLCSWQIDIFEYVHAYFLPDTRHQYLLPMPRRYLRQINDLVQYLAPRFLEQFVSVELSESVKGWKNLYLKTNITMSFSIFSLYLGKLFFHSVSRLNLVALKASACCSTVSLTIFQKHSATARLKFLVVTCPDIAKPSLKNKT